MKKAIKISILLLMVAVISIGITFSCIFLALQVNGIDSDNEFLKTDGTQFLAHRGYSDLYFSNTEEAFIEAGKQSFFAGIECEIRLTEDNIWVISHEDNPFEDKDIKISKSIYNDIKELKLREDLAGKNVANKADKVLCTLDRFVEICDESNKMPVIEIKGDYKRSVLKNMVQKITKKIDAKAVLFMSYSRSSLYELYRGVRPPNIMYLTGSEFDATSHMDYGYNVGVSKDMNVKNVVNKAATKSKLVNVRIVNSDKKAREMVDAGVDFITTDKVLSI